MNFGTRLMPIIASIALAGCAGTTGQVHQTSNIPPRPVEGWVLNEWGVWVDPSTLRGRVDSSGRPAQAMTAEEAERFFAKKNALQRKESEERDAQTQIEAERREANKIPRPGPGWVLNQWGVWVQDDRSDPAKVVPRIGMTRSQASVTYWGSHERERKTTTANGTQEIWLFADGGYFIFDETGRLAIISGR